MKVLVTGANGFVASHLIAELLSNPKYNVVGTVRSLADKRRYQHLVSLDHADLRLRLVEGDLFAAGGWPALCDGCHAVFHVASPYAIDVRDAQADLIDPAIQGTTNVVGAAFNAKVPHVVLTSSIAAITDEPVPGKTFTEADWNERSTSSRNPYYRSKVLAEQAAWRLHGAAGAASRLVVLNPTVVLGPALSSAVNTSMKMLIDAFNGSLPLIPNVSWGIVDVRDVARAHVLAMENDTTAGRYILCAAVRSMPQIIGFYRDRHPEWSGRLPRRVLPDWLAKVVAYFKSSGTKSYLLSHVGKGDYAIDASKSRMGLPLQVRDVDLTLEDTLADLLERKHIHR